MTFKHKLSKRLALLCDRGVALSAALLVGCASGDRTLAPTDPSFAVAANLPKTITDLRVTATTDTTATLAFTELDNGVGLPASYDVRYAVAPLAWGGAISVARGTCKTPMAGTTIGAARTCIVRGLSPATSYQFQAVAYRDTLNVNAVFGPLSNVASGATRTGTPGNVINLVVVAATDSSVTLSFTEVGNGAGQPASYDVRFAAGTISWPSATSVSRGSCATPVAGAAIGANRTCTILGLKASTSYQFQLVAFRGTLNVDAVFGPLSNSANGTTASSAAPAPVASVTVNPGSASVGVGQTLQLAVVLKDASGNTLTGRTVTWSSAAPLLATVNGTGLVTGVLAGAATITATSEGRSGTSAVTTTVALPPPPPPPPPPPGAGEPVINTALGDVQIYADNMDQYTTPHDMDSWPGHSLHPFYPDLYPNNYAVITSAHEIGGKALRLVYDKGNGDRFIWKTNPENISTWYAPSNAAFVLQYWFRISKNGGPGGGPGYGSTAVGMKWVEFWNVGTNVRTQFSVTAGNATTGPLWHVNPASRGPVGYQPVGPYWNQVNNNQWHRVTYVYQPASAPGATDGVARMWIDGTKIVDVSAAAAGITPPGGTKVWCTLAEVATLDVAQIGMINLGEYMNGGLGDGVTDLPMALDFDDFSWWKLLVRIR